MQKIEFVLDTFQSLRFDEFVFCIIISEYAKMQHSTRSIENSLAALAERQFSGFYKLV